jgi:agmatine deiminase
MCIRDSVYFVWKDKDSTLLVQLLSEISKKENITLFMNENATLRQQIESSITNAGGKVENIVFLQKKMLTDNNWIRDYGPLFVNRNGKFKMIKFHYWDESNEIVDYLSEKEKIGLINKRFESFGGTREFNGLGTGIFVEEHEKFITRKTGWDKAKREEELKKTFNLKKVIWLKKGIPQDELPSYGPIDVGIYPMGSSHHLDEFCRFIGPGKIMISHVGEKEANNEILKEAKRRLDENYKILVQAKDQDGNPFEIIRMPFAPVRIKPLKGEPGSNLFKAEVTSYLNFLITNHFVVLPSYVENNQDKLTETKESYIAKTFKTHFPEKDILFVNTGTLNERGGGIHCISSSKPVLKKEKRFWPKRIFRKNQRA